MDCSVVAPTLPPQERGFMTVEINPVTESIFNWEQRYCHALMLKQYWQTNEIKALFQSPNFLGFFIEKNLPQ